MLSGIIRNNKSSVLLLAVTLFLPAIGSGVSLFFLYQNAQVINNFSNIHWIIFYVLTSLTMAFALTPTSYIALVSGFFLGWASIAGLLPSYVLASIIGYALAAKLDKGKLLNQLKEDKKTNAIMENLKSDEFWVIFFCRISPAPPFAMMNVFLSFMKVEFKNFIVAGTIGMLPRTLLLIWIGSKTSDMVSMFKKDKLFEFSNLIGIGFLLLAGVSLYLIFMRAIKKYEVKNKNSKGKRNK
jgi:uncharacterized membrane protein YdjX (TVP38/TMEM64 family)